MPTVRPFLMAEGVQILMQLVDYGFSERFGWINDRFGVSWQLNLAADEQADRTV